MKLFVLFFTTHDIASLHINLLKPKTNTVLRWQITAHKNGDLQHRFSEPDTALLLCP